MNIFITGASGFIGGAITKYFSNKFEVKAMSRSQSSAEQIKLLGGNPIECDLQNVSEANLIGIDTVIHCAAFTEEWGTEENFYTVNVQGTRKLLKAAKDAKVKRFIFIGTEAALFYGQDMLNIDESYSYAKNSPYPYSRTKAEAEKLVLSANNADFFTLSLRPRMVWGPNDNSILPAVLNMIDNGQFAWIGDGQYQTSTTHIDNLVFAIDLALTKGIGGEAYFIANEEISMLKDFMSRYISTQDVVVPNKSVPKSIARGAARLLEFVWKVFKINRKPPLVRFSIDIMSSECTISIEKAKRELNYHPLISTDQGLNTMPKLTSKVTGLR